MFGRFIADEGGATSIEYGLIAAVVSVGIIAGLMAFQDSLNDLFYFVSDTVTSQM